MTAMRQIIILTHSVLLAAVLLASCATMEEIVEPQQVPQARTQGEKVHMSFTASFEADSTRNSMDSDHRVVWSNSDQITVFADGNKYDFVVESLDDEGHIATFGGEIVPSSEYLAIYPPDPCATISEQGVISTSLPSQQLAVENSFADGSNLCVAKTTGTTLRFTNVCAILAVKVNNPGIRTVTLSSKHPMSGGTAQLDFSGSTPTLQVTDALQKVTLAGIAQNTKYYFVAYPGNFTEGLRLTFTDIDGNRAIFNNSKALDLQPNASVNLGTITIPNSKWIGPAVNYYDSTVYGVYDTDIDDTIYTYRKLNDQYAITLDTKNAFRIQNVTSYTYLEVYDIPATHPVGATFNVRVLQNHTPTLDSNFVETVTVSKVQDGYLWLTSDEGRGYIVADF